MANNGSSAGSLFVAFVLGAAAGAAVALLYAPASGEETRQRIADRAREGRERAEGFVRDGREFVNRQRDNIASAVERGREAFEQARKETL
jgi:gas vesicle protein